MREAFGCFVGRWTEILDEAVSRGWGKLTIIHGAFLVACHERKEAMGKLTGKTRGIPPLTAFEPSR